ncbi:isoamylase [Chlamydiales bacterium]|nr:isoamylase [Chlamydiales bacterium]
MEISIYSGSALPLGLHKTDRGINFSIYSSHAKTLTLALFNLNRTPIKEVTLHQKTGDIWHIEMGNLPSSFLYAYSIDQGPLILDPFAKKIDSTHNWLDRTIAYSPLSLYENDKPFNWDGETPLNIPLNEIIIYEMHVRGFTQHSSSNVEQPGTFLGLIEKIPYLKSIGVNAIELLPVFEFNEKEVESKSLCNFWGYSTVHFFALNNRYSVKSSSLEFKQLIKQCHLAGIEVYLDVVYNHTAEGNSEGPAYSFKELAPEVYYLFSKTHEWVNDSGCGNTLNANHPIVREWLIQSLRFWVTEMHVDGFRFDLASVFYRGHYGTPLLDEIAEDPLLKNVKLIAEPWDAGGLYQVGDFYPQSSRFLEWNDQFRDRVRRFIKGTSDEKGNFATSIAGSQEIYQKKGSPLNSINFITCHDGFSLYDLVSYGEKHNLLNGENNRDGTNNNESWNCGFEGKTDDPLIRALRNRQMKNFLVALMVSQGIPMLSSGDEYGHSKEGNNNSWCHDTAINLFQWDELQKNQDYFRFFKEIIQLRKKHPHFKRNHFLTDKDIIWYGSTTDHPKWNYDNRYVAFLLKYPDLPSFFIGFNANYKKTSVQAPLLPENKVWQFVVNTGKDSPEDIYLENTGPLLIPHSITMMPHSTIILKETFKELYPD